MTQLWSMSALNFRALLIILWQLWGEDTVSPMSVDALTYLFNNLVKSGRTQNSHRCCCRRGRYREKWRSCSR